MSDKIALVPSNSNAPGTAAFRPIRSGERLVKANGDPIEGGAVAPNAVLLSDYTGDVDAAITAIGATKTVLHVDTNGTVSDDTTIPVTCSIQGYPGYTITVNTGKTLTINGPITNSRQIFLIGAGTYIITYEICPLEWFGAIPNTFLSGEPATNKTAIDKAIASCKRIKCYGTYFTEGDHQITGNLDIVGADSRVSCGFGLFLDVPTNGILYSTDAAHSTYQVRLHNLSFSANLKATRCIDLGEVSLVTTNCNFANASGKAAVRLRSTNNVLFHNCKFTTSKYGIFADDSGNDFNASLRIVDCYMQSITGSGVYIRECRDTVCINTRIDDCDSHAWYVYNTDSAGPTMTLLGCSCEGVDGNSVRVEGDETFWRLRMIGHVDGNNHAGHKVIDVVYLDDVSQADIDIQRVSGAECATAVRTTTNTGKVVLRTGPSDNFATGSERANTTAYAAGDRMWTNVAGDRKRYWVCITAGTTAGAIGSLYDSPAYQGDVTDGTAVFRTGEVACPFTATLLDMMVNPGTGKTTFNADVEPTQGSIKAKFGSGLEVAGEMYHSGDDAGFFGTAPITKPDVAGAKGGNVALTNLLTQLAALGLITDSTT